MAGSIPESSQATEIGLNGFEIKTEAPSRMGRKQW